MSAAFALTTGPKMSSPEGIVSLDGCSCRAALPEWGGERGKQESRRLKLRKLSFHSCTAIEPARCLPLDECIILGEPVAVRRNVLDVRALPPKVGVGVVGLDGSLCGVNGGVAGGVDEASRADEPRLPFPSRAKSSALEMPTPSCLRRWTSV